MCAHLSFMFMLFCLFLSLPLTLYGIYHFFTFLCLFVQILNHEFLCIVYVCVFMSIHYNNKAIHIFSPIYSCKKFLLFSFSPFTLFICVCVCLIRILMYFYLIFNHNLVVWFKNFFFLVFVFPSFSKQFLQFYVNEVFLFLFSFSSFSSSCFLPFSYWNWKSFPI